MPDLLFLFSVDDPLVAGYSLRSIFEYWWIGLIIIIVAAVGLAVTYFLLSWLFGRMKYKDGDAETVDNFNKAPRSERKALVKTATGAAKNVIVWRHIRSWLIPVVCVSALLTSALASFLPSAAFSNLLYAVVTWISMILKHQDKPRKKRKAMSLSYKKKARCC